MGIIELTKFNEDIPKGTTAIACGWGETSQTPSSWDDLQCTYVTIIPRNVCKKLLNHVAITDQMICAGGFIDEGKDACRVSFCILFMFHLIILLFYRVTQEVH